MKRAPVRESDAAGAESRLRVLLVLGHPRSGSFCEALADAYAEGACEAGVELRRLRVADMRFEPNVLGPSPRDQPVEPAIVEAMELVAWADHLVFVFPTWWGSMPALLKAFLDRVLMPGFAFEDREDGEGWHRLLAGKTAHLLTTMDTPPLVYRLIYGSPGLNGLARATLGFCGIAPVRRSIFGPVKGSGEARRRHWIDEARDAGRALRHGVLRPAEQRLRTALAWLAALRLQFHPMVWLAYGLGCTTALHTTGEFSATKFWLGLACLFAFEAATVFVNEIFDWPSDRRNTHAGPFTGGSRVIVDGRLSEQQLGAGALVTLVVAGVLVWSMPEPPAAALSVLGLLAVLAIGYTAPPLKLCWRGLGEVNVAATHSFLVVMFGHTLMGAPPGEPLPWAVSLPLFFAVLPAITLSGIPDLDADKAAGKQTLAVLLGSRGAVRIAQGTAVTATLAAGLLCLIAPAAQVFLWLGVLSLPHACWLVWRLERYLHSGRPPGRIDGLMALALSYILWFVVVPLALLISGLP